MKNIFMASCVLGAIISCSIAVMPQTQNSNNGNKNEKGQAQKDVYNTKRGIEQKDQLALAKKFDESLEVSPAAQALNREIALGNSKAILEAAKTGDKSLIPYLRLLSGNDWADAQVALFRLDDKETLNRVIEQSKLGNDFQKRVLAIRALAMIGNKEAYRRLYELLDDPEVIKSDADDVFIPPTRYIVIIELSKVVKNPPNAQNALGEKEFDLWKQWFETNHLID